jgi:hypothetical protein
MQAWGKPDWNRLGSVIRETRSSKLVHRLFFGQADAALVNRNGYEVALGLNPQIGQRLQVLEAFSFKARSPHIGLFSARMPAEQREAVTRAALTLNDSVRGRQVLDIYMADSLVRTRVADLEPYRQLIETQRSLKAAAGNKGGR